MTIRPILETWVELQTKILAFHKGPYKHNIVHAIHNIRNLANHIQEHLATIQAWLNTYLDANREELCIRNWLETANEYFLHWLDTKQDYGHISSRIHEWDAMFPDDTVCFSQASTIVRRTVQQMNPDLCDDPDILETHKDKPCVSNGWYCDMCDDIEHAWKAKLVRKVTQSEHVLLNRSLHDAFWNKVKGSTHIPTTWTFPKIYNDAYSLYEKPIETKEGMIQAANSRRRVYTKQGKTPFQACEEFLSVLSSLDSGWTIQGHQIDTDWKIFRQCIHKMDIVSYVLSLDLVRCREIEDML